MWVYLLVTTMTSTCLPTCNSCKEVTHHVAGVNLLEGRNFVIFTRR